MATVSISSQDFETYVIAADADTYFIPGVSAAATAFKALADADTKNSYLVTATRYLDSLNWAAAYDTFAEREVVQAILDACCELAAAFVSDPDLGTSITAEVRRLKAGSVEIENYRQTVDKTSGSAVSFLPPNVLSMLKQYLGGSTVVASSYAFGTSRESTVEDFERELD